MWCCGAAAALAPAASLAAPRPTPEEPVARVDGQALSRAEIETRINGQIPAVRRRYKSQDARREFVDRQVDLELLAAEARRRGLEADPEVRRVVAQALAHRLLELVVAGTPPPDEPSLAAFWEEHAAEYQKPATRRVAHLLVQLKPRGAHGHAKAREKAQRLFEEALAHREDNAHFQHLVELNTDDKDTRLRGGDLRYFTRDEASIPEAVRETAFGMPELGDVALCESPLGFHVLKLIGRRGPVQAKLQDVRDKVQKRMRRDQRGRAGDALIEELRRRASIEVDPKAIRRIRLQRP